MTRHPSSAVPRANGVPAAGGHDASLHHHTPGTPIGSARPREAATLRPDHRPVSRAAAGPNRSVRLAGQKPPSIRQGGAS